MIRISELKLPLDYEAHTLEWHAAKYLRVPEGDVIGVKIVRRSIDARDKSDIRIVFTLDAELKTQPMRLPPKASVITLAPARVFTPTRMPDKPPLVVGMGPCGLFAALTLAKMGLKPVVIERGKGVDERVEDVKRFWLTGTLDVNSNVQFGEGGAGAFSDGKLTSGIKDPRCREVLQAFYEAGAPEEILYAAKPHIGTDRLMPMVKNMRERIISLGGTVLFEHTLIRPLIDGGRVAGALIRRGDGSTFSLSTNDIILAVGHSARDTFSELNAQGVTMSRKPFSIGVRIEHLQAGINLAQYGKAASALGAADYKLSAHLASGRAAYTFCMCPGGCVVAAASEGCGVVTNGMSLFSRDGVNANSALLISVSPDDFGGSDALAGVRFQQKYERLAYEAGGGGYIAPAQLAGDFLRRVRSRGAREVQPSYRPGVAWRELDACLPAFAAEGLREALIAFGKKIRGFADDGAVLTGVETRSSSPVRIDRNERGEASLKGLYPAGEGAGYAGGILSAAVDGIKAAEAVMTHNDQVTP